MAPKFQLEHGKLPNLEQSCGLYEPDESRRARRGELGGGLIRQPLAGLLNTREVLIVRHFFISLAGPAGRGGGEVPFEEPYTGTGHSGAACRNVAT